jgi:hypothetical protein
VTARLSAVLLLLAPLTAEGRQPAQPSPEPTVVTSGEGIVTAVPDRAWITIGAESRASNPREAQRRNADAMRPVQQKLLAAGVAPDAIRTVGYDLQYEWDVVNNRRVGRGYLARNTIEVRIDNVERVGEFLEIAVGSGATLLGGIRFDLKDRAKLEREALRLAVSDARTKADAAAAGAGRIVDRVVRIDEQGLSPRPTPQLMLRETATVAPDTPPIAAGQTQIVARVTLTVTIK